MSVYESTYQYKLIYVFAIHDPEHEGFLKIGEASLDSTLGPNQILPNCDALNGAAHARIKQYTKTALIQYELLYTELALRFTKMADGTTMPNPFNDSDIHDVLSRSGYLCKKFPDTDKDSEWYGVNVQTAINAIHAFKEGRLQLNADEKDSVPVREGKTIKKGITLRQEQEDAIAKTLAQFKKGNTMLWNCKMRFGKTVTAYELIRRAGFQKTIVVTHRPVVEDGWRTDHALIFGEQSNHLFVTKEVQGANYEYDSAIDSENDRILRNYAKQDASFVYFASMQDLRGSRLAGGKFNKNVAVFEMPWDCVIYDEAHEGTQTELGQSVQQLLEKKHIGKKPKVLSLSGTPYNLLGQYEENVYSWDYVMEQKRKHEFAAFHPDEHNPYENLPEMRIMTFDLHDSMPTSYRYETEELAFNFREFFRTWTGNLKQDFRPIPAGAHLGGFVHEDDVRAFLDLISRDDTDSYYPFANQQYRDMFKHTFWMVPGVKEARALSALLKQHPVFGQFGIANVAGEGDEEEAYDDALKTVRDIISQNEYSITISCGRLTTGVTVPEWSAVMMLAGSNTTAAAGYMQTIFRVQSVGSIDGKQKKVAYVFDFAPDRALKVLSEVHSLTNRSKTGEEDAKVALGEFINFCPVLAVNGTKMAQFDVASMMRQIKKMTVDKAVKSGFEDDSLYNANTGLVMDDTDVKLFNHLASVVHGQPKSKLPKNVTINKQGMDNEQYEKAEKAKNKPKRERTKEEQEALDKMKELKKEREKVLQLLRAVSIRLPMLIYGARVDLNEGIRMKDFIDIVDEESWVEFMPANVSKELFKQLLKYYDEDVVVGAGLRIRRLARAADELPPTQRVKRIAEIFALFRNPDKETVLTPWRVVNMHMGDCIGGYNFYGESYGKDDIQEEPRLIDQGDVTADLFLDPDIKVLEMNSKSGLYPLYLAYSLYAMKLPKNERLIPLEETQRMWAEVLKQNIFVLCKTKMAVCITRRTLAGYQDNWTVNAIHLSKLLTRMEVMSRLSKKLTNPATWDKEGERLKFDAVVGNPPYQVSDGGNSASATPIYQMFVEQAKALSPKYISMITPARWYSGGRGLDDYRNNMMNDRHLRRIVDFPSIEDVFECVDISGGVSYFLWDAQYNGECHFSNVVKGVRINSARFLNEFSFVVRDNKAIDIIRKVFAVEDITNTLESTVSPQKPFDLRTNYTPLDSGIPCYFIQKIGKKYASPDDVKDANNLLDKWKLLVPRSPIAGQTDFNKPVGFYYDGNTNIAQPGECCTESFIVAGAFDTYEEVVSFKSYLFTKCVRFLLLQAVVSQDVSRNKFCFVPRMKEYNTEYTDASLREKWHITDEEWAYIDSKIHNYDRK